MGLFDVFRRKTKTHASQLSTPLQIAREVERLIEAGDLRLALDVAEKGVYENPRSEVVNAAYRYLRRTTLGEDVVTLRKEVESTPSAVRYARLADSYKEIGDYDKALETCYAAIQRYPDHEGPWIILAQIRLERFREDWIPRDAELAIDFYEKAFDLNRSSYRTLIDLAELYAELGVKKRAIRKCEAILYFAPDDEKALRILRKAQALQDDKREDLSDRIATYAEKRRRALQRRSRRPGDPLGPSGRLVKDPDLLRAKFRSLEGFLEGMLAAVGTSLEGEVVASSTSGEIDTAVLGEVSAELFAGANRCSLLMDIGHFKRGIFEGPDGLTYLIEFDQLRIAVLYAPKTRFDRLEEAMTRFVEDELYL